MGDALHELRARLPAIHRGADRAHAGAAWLFLRAVGAVYVAAFLSLHGQVLGLVGERGILPATRIIEHLHEAGPGVFRLLGTGDTALRGACLAGALAGGALVLDLAPAIAAAAAWLLYFSLCGVGRDFMRFQWDGLLLETGLLAVFLAPWRLAPRGPRAAEPPPPAALFAARLLAFKLMFLSGLVKLTWDDRTWWDLSALHYHFETQPLPTWLAWYAHRLPAAVQAASA
ncbi:MAG TPA: lipase maturation factor family protein, partial [Planctomycetota bacterium]|nr:lipase maturation factor family protein [Planctomycetota bacterium]